jgi:hypothetical protein
MARIALAAAGAAAGFLIAGPVGLGLGASAVMGAVSVGLSVGELIGAFAFRPKSALQMPLQDLQVSSSADGAPIPFGYGKCRFAGQIIWAPKISFKLEHINPPGGGSGGGAGSNQYFYFADFAVAFGEGPATILRIWGDSKLIYKAPNANAPGNTEPLGDTPPWDPTVTYATDDMVTYPGVVTVDNPLGQYVYQAILPVPAGITPPGNSLYWSLDSEFPPWRSSGVTYLPGMTVDYKGQIYAVEKTPAVGPPAGNTAWRPLQQYYTVPTMYPGDENQLPDPLIQGAEGVNVTPAFRGICYAVYENFPLANFGNRIPNIRAEILFGLPSAPSFAAPPVVNQNDEHDLEPANPSVSLPSVTAGNYIIVGARWRNVHSGPPATISDTRNNNWIPVLQGPDVGAWYAIAKDSGPITVNVADTGGGGYYNADAWVMQVDASAGMLQTSAAQDDSADAILSAGGVSIDVPMFDESPTQWFGAIFTFVAPGSTSSIVFVSSDNGFTNTPPAGWAYQFPATQDETSFSEVLSTV